MCKAVFCPSLYSLYISNSGGEFKVSLSLSVMRLHVTTLKYYIQLPQCTEFTASFHSGQSVTKEQSPSQRRYESLNLSSLPNSRYMIEYPHELPLSSAPQGSTYHWALHCFHSNRALDISIPKGQRVVYIHTASQHRTQITRQTHTERSASIHQSIHQCLLRSSDQLNKSSFSDLKLSNPYSIT